MKKNITKCHYTHLRSRLIADSIWTHHVADCMYLIFKYDVKIMHYCICLYVCISFARLVRQCAVVVFVVVDVFSLLFSIRVQSSLRFFRQCVRTVLFCSLQFCFYGLFCGSCRFSLLITFNRCERYGSIELK